MQEFEKLGVFHLGGEYDVQNTSHPAIEQLAAITIKPRKKDINVKGLGLAWCPFLQKAGKAPEPAW